MTDVKTVKYIVSGSGVLTLWLTREDGTNKTYSVPTDHENHRKIVEKLKAKDWKNLEEMISAERRLETAKDRAAERIAEAKLPGSLIGTAEIRDEQIYVNNVPVHNVVTERLLQLAKDGYPVDPVLRFLENVLMNRSSRSQEELYDFLANRNLPLTEDGCFLAYKRIRGDWKDIYTGTIDNSIGKIVEIPWKDVNPDRTKECSYGLHVGALDYVRIYGAGRDTRVVVVKVNPKDCVSVPRDYSHQKLRVCKYEVLYELETGDQVALGLPVYSSTGGQYTDMGDWVDDLEEGDDKDADQYWKQGWGDDYEDWSIARLRKEVTDRELVYNDAEATQLTYEDLLDLLRDDDQAQRDEEERDIVDDEEVEDDFDDEEEEDPCGNGDCEYYNPVTEEEDEEEEDTFLESFEPKQAEASQLVNLQTQALQASQVLPNQVWVFSEKLTGLLFALNGDMASKIGTRVIVQEVALGGAHNNQLFVTYYPKLTGSNGSGQMALADFVKHFTFLL